MINLDAEMKGFIDRIERLGRDDDLASMLEDMLRIRRKWNSMSEEARAKLDIVKELDQIEDGLASLEAWHAGDQEKAAALLQRGEEEGKSARAPEPENS